MTTLQFVPLVEPTPDIAEALTCWENDPALIPLTRPSPTKEDLERRAVVSLEELVRRLAYQHISLIYLDGQLVGEVNYQVDPPHLFKKVAGTAWIGITIGESSGRGRGVGYQALRYLEQHIQSHGCGRIELGVFEYNAPAIALYRKLSYREIARIPDFTYWEGRMWHDIRMEKGVPRQVPGV